MRPTSGKVVEALVSILASRWPGGSLLECFAGTGRLSLAALARGAGRVVLVEADRGVARRLGEELERQGWGGKAKVVFGRAESVIRTLETEPFDVVYLDPPYQFDEPAWEKILGMLPAGGLLADGGIIVAEHFHKTRPGHPDLSVVDERRYGQTAVTFFTPRLREVMKGAP